MKWKILYYLTLFFPKLYQTLNILRNRLHRVIPLRLKSLRYLPLIPTANSRRTLWLTQISSCFGQLHFKIAQEISFILFDQLCFLFLLLLDEDFFFKLAHVFDWIVLRWGVGFVGLGFVVFWGFLFVGFVFLEELFSCLPNKIMHDPPLQLLMLNLLHYLIPSIIIPLINHYTPIFIRIKSIFYYFF